jgi:hypothetical protein
VHADFLYIYWGMPLAVLVYGTKASFGGSAPRAD